MLKLNLLLRYFTELQSQIPQYPILFFCLSPMPPSQRNFAMISYAASHSKITPSPHSLLHDLLDCWVPRSEFWIFQQNELYKLSLLINCAKKAPSLWETRRWPQLCLQGGNVIGKMNFPSQIFLSIHSNSQPVRLSRQGRDTEKQSILIVVKT